MAIPFCSDHPEPDEQPETCRDCVAAQNVRQMYAEHREVFTNCTWWSMCDHSRGDDGDGSEGQAMTVVEARALAVMVAVADLDLGHLPLAERVWAGGGAFAFRYDSPVMLMDGPVFLVRGGRVEVRYGLDGQEAVVGMAPLWAAGGPAAGYNNRRT